MNRRFSTSPKRTHCSTKTAENVITCHLDRGRVQVQQHIYNIGYIIIPFLIKEALTPIPNPVIICVDNTQRVCHFKLNPKHPIENRASGVVPLNLNSKDVCMLCCP